MTNDLQALVDQLALELGHPVDVDDRRFRLLAYSSHHDHVDAVRLASILRREGPEEARDWLDALDLDAVERLVCIPPNPALGMSARICVPIRFRHTLLGFLWLVAGDAEFTDAQLECVLRYADDVALVLYRRRLAGQEERRRERRLATQLLGLEPGDPCAAASWLLEDGLLTTARGYRVLTVQLRPVDRPRRVEDAVRVRLVEGVERLRRALPPRRMLALAVGQTASVVLAVTDPAEASRAAHQLLGAIDEQLADRIGWTAMVGVGGSRSDLAEVHGSYREARRAVVLGGTIDTLGPIVDWEDLGAYRTLSRLVDGVSASAALPETLKRLMAVDLDGTLVRTLDVYLEHAGDAKTTAAELFLHRSSLYNRLRRVEEVAGVDLRSGDHRLELQLGLRLLRMAGRAGETLPAPAPARIPASA